MICSGSHDKTFEIAAKGTVVVTDAAGNTIFSHAVNPGDIYRFSTMTLVEHFY